MDMSPYILFQIIVLICLVPIFAEATNSTTKNETISVTTTKKPSTSVTGVQCWDKEREHYGEDMQRIPDGNERVYDAQTRGCCKKHGKCKKWQLTEGVISTYCIVNSSKKEDDMKKCCAAKPTTLRKFGSSTTKFDTNSEKFKNMYNC